MSLGDSPTDESCTIHKGLCIEILQRVPKPAVSAVPQGSHERLVAISHCP